MNAHTLDTALKEISAAFEQKNNEIIALETCLRRQPCACYTTGFDSESYQEHICPRCTELDSRGFKDIHGGLRRVEPRAR